MKNSSIVRLKTLPLTVIGLFALVCPAVYADRFTVSKVSWVGDSLRIELQTDRPDGAELNAQLARDKTGEHTVSILKFGTVSGGRFVLDADISDEDKPLRAGRYWLTIANGYDFLPVAAVLPLIIPKHEQSSGKGKTIESSDDEPSRPEPSVSQLKQSWADDVLRIEGKTDLSNGSWLNIAIQDDDGTLVTDEGFICAQVSRGRFVVEGFTKDGIDPLPSGHYKLSVQAQNPLQSGALFVEKPFTITKRPRSRRTRLAEVRAVNVMNYDKAKNNEPAATSLAEVSDFVQEESDMQVQHAADKKKQSVLQQQQRKSDTDVDTASDEATVRRADGMKFIALASDAEVMAELATDLTADDEQGAEALARNGKLCFLKDNTRVSIIERGPMLTVVRVLNGPHKGRRGLVASEAINE